jgi:hypothetical protein
VVIAKTQGLKNKTECFINSSGSYITLKQRLVIPLTQSIFKSFLLKKIMINLKKLNILLIFIFITIDSALAQATAIEVGDLPRFGETYVNKEVQMIGLFEDTYICRAPSNKGYRCLQLRHPSNKKALSVDLAIIRDGQYSIDQYKAWLNNKSTLRLTGKVELRETISNGFTPGSGPTPTLVVRTIELLK